MIQMIMIVIIVVLLALLVLSTIKVVPQANAYVIERLGAYNTTWNTGLHIKVPFVDRIANKVTLKEVVQDFAPQPVITKDNVTMQIDTVVYYQITDPKLYTYGVVGPVTAIETLTATTLRNIIGELELDETLTSRDIINTKMRAILDDATDPWGIKVGRVEVKNIIPPRDIQPWKNRCGQNANAVNRFSAQKVRNGPAFLPRKVKRKPWFCGPMHRKKP